MIQFLHKHSFKNRWFNLCSALITLFVILPADAQTLVTSVEAESGTRAGGLTIANSNAGYSGSGYVTNMVNTGDNLTIPVTVPSAGNYKLVIRYNGPYGVKDQDIYVNGVFVSSLNFPATTGYTDLTAGSLTLNAGSNTIGIYKNWGYTDFDKVTLYTVPLHDYTTVAAAPIDPAATKEALALYNYFKSSYGQTIISGQTSDYYTTVSPNAAKKPVLRAYDFQHYTVGYSYKWNTTTNSQGFGWDDDGTTQAAIDWYNSTCQKGIVAFHWHWHSPSGGQAGTNTFYTNSTTFDVTKAVTAGTAENTAVIRDIDSIATQLKKLQAAGVPVMWRPLHEAGGAWFWWGAKGSAAALALYDIVYNRLVNYHGIHNLIWQWSTPEPSWYPGNSKVDMLGYDSYPGAYNYGTQKLIFDQLYTIVNGQKMVAMTENGPIPDPDACFASDAKWAYFMSWSDLVTQQNSAAQLSLVYNHAKVTTLDEVTTATNTAQITATGPTSFCTGGSVLLKANVAKGYTYKWYYNGNVITSATSSMYTAAAAGSYTVAVTATGSCTTTSAPIVVTMGGPTATITAATATTFCQGGSVVLNASTGSGYTYQWNVGGNPISGATTASYTATATGLYSVKVSLSTCNATSVGTQVTVNALPTITGTPTVCVNAITPLTGTGTPDATSPWTSATPTVATVNSAGVVTGLAPGTSIISYKNSLGCTATTPITVYALPTATITAGGTTTFCQGGNVVLTSSTGTSYKWMLGGSAINGATNATYTATATGSYTVEVTNTNNCKATSAATTVAVNALPTATITAGGATTFCQGGNVVLTSSTGTSYKWMLGGTAISGATSATYTATSTGSYTVEVTNANTCKATSAATTVAVNALPTATITAGGTTTFCQGGNVVLTS
ncbi:glycosyl hydrolase, partial [Cytophaga aurantiaca]|uniref:glycosyl hydrolase n=1 Tax=Cytophaga aurantiaca TaxID=29530 RepID=UPI0024801795